MMLNALQHADGRARINLLLLALFWTIVLLFGGASRADAMSQPVVRLAAVALIAVSAVQLRREEWRRIRLPVLFLIAIAAMIAIQLIPLPPGIWESLPGRALYADALRSAGIEPVWRPLSLTPDLTLNSLLAILPPLAMALALGTVPRDAYGALIPLLLGGVALSVFFGLMQISGALPYLYRVTNQGYAVGLFANRNHQALLLAIAFPLLACWACAPGADPLYRQVRAWIALCAAAALFPLLLILGSRGGLIFGLAGVVIGAALFYSARSRRSASLRRQALIAAIPVLFGGVAVAAALALSRDEALQRLIGPQEQETRIDLLSTFARMIGDFFPFGSGYGSFDPVFRSYEDYSWLRATYLNHAHNDLAEILIEGGIVPLLLLAAFLIWFARRAWALWRRRVRDFNQLLGRMASGATALLLAGSVVDYPLRTPILSVMLAIFCVLMAKGGSPDSEAGAQ